MTRKEHSFWLAKAVEEINQQRPEGDLIVSSGASPSGPYHIGHLREFLTADAIAWGLRRVGRQARHIHFVDDLDGLRKIPRDVPRSYEQYLGMPYCKIPAPDGSNKSYADFFFDQIHEAMQRLGAEMEVVYSHEQYETGRFVPAIEKTLSNLDKTRSIIEQTSGRQLQKNWVPIEIRDEHGKYADGVYRDYNADSQTVSYETRDGEVKHASYADGSVKLNWRVDWPARWALLPVAVEPFGRDHATKGGSYDTGSELARQLFDSEPPFPVPYEFINLRGNTKKMSASSGDGILPSEALTVLPPALLKSFVLSARPSLQLFFDLGQGFGRMYELFDDEWRKYADDCTLVTPIALAVSGVDTVPSTSIPFSHLVVSYQTGQRNKETAIEILRRSEHRDVVDEQKSDILQIFDYIHNWLEKWAPEELRFVVQKELPDTELSQEQIAMLAELADIIEPEDHAGDGEWFHRLVHETREKHNLEPKQAFQAIYQVLLGKDYGPKAGWFLSTLDHGMLINRFRLKS